MPGMHLLTTPNDREDLFLVNSCFSCLKIHILFLRRHLLRLWLRNEDLAWKTPKALEANWKRLYEVTADEQRFPLEPEIRSASKGGGAKY
jgi:hypothetical protein